MDNSNYWLRPSHQGTLLIKNCTIKHKINQIFSTTFASIGKQPFSHSACFAYEHSIRFQIQHNKTAVINEMIKSRQIHVTTALNEWHKSKKTCHKKNYKQYSELKHQHIGTFCNLSTLI